MAKTIDLDSRTIPDVCKELVNLEFSYGHDRHLRKYSHQMFARQKREIDNLFSEWLHETNKNLLNDVEIFVKDAMTSSSLFGQTKSSLHAANVILGMPLADYLPTLDTIEKYIDEIQHDLKVLRVGSTLTKKSNLLEVVSQIEGQANVLVIIDRIETIDFPLLKSLVDSLLDLLQRTTTNNIIVLFCMSNSSYIIERILPIRANTSMSKIRTIVKDPGDLIKSMSSKILMGGDFSFNVDPNIVNTISDDFVYNDPSVTNLKYLYQCSLFQHCIRNKHCFRNLAILLLPRNDLTKILKSEPNLIPGIKGLKSMSYKSANGLNWDNPSAVADLCFDQIKELRSYHQFILGQIQYYLDMLRDPTGESISDLNDIYSELVKYDDLGHSPLFVDEISKLHKFSTRSILGRLDRSTGQKRKLPKLRENHTDVYKILVEFKEKLINNDNSKDIVTELINSLLKHTQELKNPFKTPLSEVLFYSDVHSLEERALPTDWVFTPRDFLDKSDPFGMLYDLVHGGAEELSAFDLFNDFKYRFEELECRKRKDLGLSNSAVKLKVRPKRLRNTMAPLKINDDDHDEHPIDEGLLKALFLDLLIDMENMGLIKTGKRKNTKGTIKVCHWFD